MNNFTVHKIEFYIYQLFYFFCFFPYVSIINLPSDTQPYAVLIGFFIILLQQKFYVSKHLLFSSLLIPSAILIMFISDVEMTGVRSLIGYFSFFIIGLSSQNSNQKTTLSSNTFLVFFSFWIILAIIQLTINRDLGSSLISNMRTTSERGVTSFAPEPSYYGIMLIFFYILNKIYYKIRFLNLIIGFQIIFFSQSFMIIGLYLVYLFLIVFFRSNLKTKIMLITIPAIILLLLNYFINSIQLENDFRVIKLIKLALKGPQTLFKIDASANDRLAHIVYSFKGTIKNWFLPNGYNSWSTFIKNEVSKQQFFWWVSSGRIMSTYGSCFYELGFIGIIVPLTINLTIIKSKKVLRENFYSLLIFINLFLLTAIPLAFPPLSFLIGFIASMNRKERKRDEKGIIYSSITPPYNRPS